MIIFPSDGLGYIETPSKSFFLLFNTDCKVIVSVPITLPLNGAPSILDITSGGLVTEFEAS